MLSRIDHKERVGFLLPEEELGLWRQYQATPFRSRKWTRDLELSTALALRKRMKIMRSLLNSDAGR